MNINKHLKFNIQKHRLDNGLNVLLYKDTSNPLVCINLLYKTGSVNDPKDKTGLAHLFEHMMFQGSVNVEKGKHFYHIQQAGGSANAATSYETTVYHENLPAEYLETAIWLEADRMGYFLPALSEEKLQNQIEVVKNERLERTDNAPYGTSWENLMELVFGADHPYGHPIIGRMDHIGKISTDDIRSFFTRYYNPANASLVIAGNFNETDTLRMVNNYFAEFKGIAPAEKNPNVPLSPLKEVKSRIVEDKIELVKVTVAFPTTNLFTDDEVSINMLNELLNEGKNSILKRELIYNKQIAVGVSSYHFCSKFGGAQVVTAFVTPGVDWQIVRDEILTLMRSLSSYRLTPAEVEKSRNRLISDFLYPLEPLAGMAQIFNYYDYYLGNADSVEYDLSRYLKVKNEDMNNAAQRYFSDAHAELIYIPRGGGNNA